jgi:hypothetical protein
MIGYMMSRLPGRRAWLCLAWCSFCSMAIGLGRRLGLMALHIGELPKIATIVRHNKQDWTLGHTTL